MAKNPDDPAEKRYAKLYPNMNEALKREKEYYEALGRFLAAFSQMETAMTLHLWHTAGVSKEIGRSVFSGVRAKEAGDFCRRIMEALGSKKEDQEAFKYLTDQLGDLNAARNDLVHYGAQAIGSENAYVTNALKAHLEQRVINFPVSAAILEQMRKDALKITLHLHYEWSDGREWPKSVLAQAALDRALQSPWQYKHQPRPAFQKAGKDKKPQA